MASTNAPRPSGAAGSGTAVVVLAGGRSRRWGGTDKTAVLLADRAVLLHVVEGVLAAFDGAVPVVVVGPTGHPAAGRAQARWVLEDPPGGGPVAGLAAGVAALPEQVGLIGLIAGDAPFGGPAVRRLTAALAADDAADAVIGRDAHGRWQPLLAAYRATALRRALATGAPAGRAVRDLIAGLTVRTAAVDDREALDLDTPEALVHAQRMLTGRG